MLVFVVEYFATVKDSVGRMKSVVGIICQVNMLLVKALSARYNKINTYSVSNSTSAKRGLLWN